MPWHWQTIFGFHRHHKGNKPLALIKLPIFPLADCSFSGLGHTLCSSCSFPLAHHSHICQHNYLCGCTANWFSWKTTRKQNSVPKCSLLQSCTNSYAGTKQKKSEGGNKQPWVWPDWAGITVHRAMVLAARMLLQHGGRTVFWLEKARWSLWQSLPCQSKGQCMYLRWDMNILILNPLNCLFL